MSNRNVFRHGDTMIAVASAPAVIGFDAILAAVKVVEDQYETMTPWEHCDGFEHTAKPAHRLDAADARAMQGYCRTFDHGERYVIQLRAGEDYGLYKYARERGASRQVAAEMVAAERRRTIRQLVKWYEDGWEWFGVRCRFAVLNDEFEDSLWGIDDAEYAESLKEELALNVAAQLEKAGYTVTSKPERRPAQGREEKRQSLRRRLAAQNWAA
jgi:hypothetical protein